VKTDSRGFAIIQKDEQHGCAKVTWLQQSDNTFEWQMNKSIVEDVFAVGERFNR